MNFGLNEIEIKNRNMVRRSIEAGTSTYVEGDTITGYIYNPDGTYTKHYLVPNYRNIAQFICCDRKDKLLCNKYDYAIASTIGEYIDLADGEFLEQILPLVTPIQRMHRIMEFNEIDGDIKE